MDTTLQLKGVPPGIVTDLVVARPGLSPLLDFSLLLGLSDEFPEAFSNNSMLAHPLPNAFGNGKDDEVVIENSVVLFYDPARLEGIDVEPWQLVAGSLPEEKRPDVYVCVEIDYDALADLQAGVNLQLNDPKIIGADGDSHWRACGRILLIQAQGRDEVLRCAQERKNILHGSQTNQSQQARDPDRDVVPEVED